MTKVTFVAVKGVPEDTPPAGGVTSAFVGSPADFPFEAFSCSFLRRFSARQLPVTGSNVPPSGHEFETALRPPVAGGIGC